MLVVSTAGPRTLLQIQDYFHPDCEKTGQEPTKAEFISSLEHSASGKLPTIHQMRTVPDDFSDPESLGEFFDNFTAQERIRIFDVAVQGSRLELSRASIDDRYIYAGFNDVIFYTLLDGGFNRRPEVQEFDPQTTSKIINQLEQLAVEHAEKCADLTRWVSWGTEETDNVLRLAMWAAELRGVAIGVLQGKVPGEYRCPGDPKEW